MQAEKDVFGIQVHPAAFRFISRAAKSFASFTKAEVFAISELCHQLHGFNLWNKMIAVYPCATLSAAIAKNNLISNSKYNLTGAMSLDSFGLNRYSAAKVFDTQIKLSSFKKITHPEYLRDTYDIHLSFYSPITSQNALEGSASAVIGANSFGIHQEQDYVNTCSQQMYFGNSNSTQPIGYFYNSYRKNGGYGFSKASDITSENTKGFFIGNGPDMTCYLNGQPFGRQLGLTPSIIHPNNPYTIKIFNSTNGTGSKKLTIGFASVGYGLSQKDIINLNKTVLSYVKNLNRE